MSTQAVLSSPRDVRYNGEQPQSQQQLNDTTRALSPRGVTPAGNVEDQLRINKCQQLMFQHQQQQRPQKHPLDTFRAWQQQAEARNAAMTLSNEASRAIEVTASAAAAPQPVNKEEGQQPKTPSEAITPIVLSPPRQILSPPRRSSTEGTLQQSILSPPRQAPVIVTGPIQTRSPLTTSPSPRSPVSATPQPQPVKFGILGTRSAVSVGASPQQQQQPAAPTRSVVVGGGGGFNRSMVRQKTEGVVLSPTIREQPSFPSVAESSKATTRSIPLYNQHQVLSPPPTPSETNSDRQQQQIGETIAGGGKGSMLSLVGMIVGSAPGGVLLSPTRER